MTSFSLFNVVLRLGIQKSISRTNWNFMFTVRVGTGISPYTCIESSISLWAIKNKSLYPFSIDKPSLLPTSRNVMRSWNKLSISRAATLASEEGLFWWKLHSQKYNESFVIGKRIISVPMTVLSRKNITIWRITCQIFQCVRICRFESEILFIYIPAMKTPSWNSVLYNG